MTGVLHLIATGGCGINLLADIKLELEELGGSFAKIKYSYIDTTDKTIQAHADLAEDFTLIKSKRASVDAIDGMGGERASKEATMDINANIKEYVDKLTNDVHVYYVVISSGSGASGSLISPLLTKELLAKGCNTVVTLVGDSSNLLGLHNTINTISTFQSIVSEKKGRENPSAASLPMIYYSNTIDGNTTPATEKAVNDRVFKMLSILAMYTSGSIQNIDNTDMGLFFRASDYKSVDVDPGLYTLGVAIGSLDDKLTVMARTVISEDESIDIKIPLVHNKIGIAADDFKSYFKELPLYLLLRTGIMNVEARKLKETLDSMEEKRHTNYEDIESLDRSELDDDLGLVV